MTRLRPILALTPAWLLVACERSGPPAEASAPVGRAVGEAIFVDGTAASGIDFDVDRAPAGDYFMPDSMAAGCGLIDYDGDGDLDVFVVSGVRDGDGRTATPTGASRLFRQDPGGRFTDVTGAAGVGHEGYGMGVAAGDVDNDGDVDLYVSCYGPDTLLRNEGDGTFTDATGVAGIANDAWSASAAFLDYDGDGFLDLYVTNYLDYDPGKRSVDAAGRPEYAAPHMFDGVPDVLYRNDGDGTFTDVSVATGIATRAGKGLGVVCLDLQGDGRPDLYVANDGEANVAWINGGGSFTDEALERGIALGGTGQREAGMGVAVGDGDGDGDDDLFVTHLVQETNTLYRQLSGGHFEDATTDAGLGAASLDVTAFGTAFADLDLDGDLDLLAVNGRVLRRVPHPGARLSPHWSPYAEPNQVFLNDGGGRFTPAASCGAFCADVEVGRGLALGDVDDDGDLDAVVTNGNGTLKLYRNEAPRRGHWLRVRALDPGLGRDAIGAVVEVVTPDGGRRRRTIDPAGSYLSTHDPRAHFGLGASDAVRRVTVTWPGGTREHFEGGPADRTIEVVRGRGTADTG